MRHSRKPTVSVRRGVTWAVVGALAVGVVTALAWTAANALDGRSIGGPFTASARAVRVQPPTPVAPPGSPAPGSSPSVTYPPGPPGCGLSSAAFCDNFEEARNTQGNRNGDLSTAHFSLARWRSELGSDPAHVEPGQIPACRAGASANPLPPGDSLICDPSSAIQSHYALVSTAEQNYGDNYYRVGQQFDIGGRTGTISFETSLYVQSGLLGWPQIAFTSDPYNAPSYLADNSAGPTPREGLELQFNSVCPGPSGWTAFPNLRTYSRYQETAVHDENGFDSWCTSAIQTEQGHLNQVVVKLSQTHIEVDATDASPDGVNFGALRKVYSAPINLSFSRGYVYFGVHNHATVKYAGLPSWNVPWDNFAFDGPQLPADRVYQVDNSAVPDGSGMDLGWWLPDSTTGGASPALALGNVSTAGSSSARLVFDLGADEITNSNWSDWRINYRLNSGAWHAVGLSADELVLMPQRGGSFIFSVPVDLAELGQGPNTVQFSGTNFFGGYKPYIANVDLIVS